MQMNTPSRKPDPARLPQSSESDVSDPEVFRTVPLKDVGSVVLCALGGFTPYPVMSALTHFPEDFGATPPSRQAAE